MSTAESPRVVAVVQARMGSTRLPGKVLKPIAGKPLLWHVVHRLKKSRSVRDIVITTSTNVLDDAIVEFCRLNAIEVVRGREFDVLSRFARAAEITDAEIVVRVCADAPFIDPGYIDHLVEALVTQGGDFVQLEEGAVTAHEGVDVFSRRGLDKLMMDASGDPVAREHVAGYFRLHMDFVPVVRAAPYPALAKDAGRLTVDTPDDLTFAEAVHARLEAKAGEASLADLLVLLEREPSLRQINAHVKQKAIAPQGGLALIRCSAGGADGMNRVRRAIALARALRDREGIGAAFAVTGTDAALRPIREAGFEAECVAPGNLTGTMSTPDIVVIDGGQDLSPADLAAMPAAVKAVVEDVSGCRLAADFAYYPPYLGAETLDWSGARTALRTGWEWALIPAVQTIARPRSRAARPTLLIAMGDSDQAGLTARVARALMLLPPVFRARFVIGAQFDHKENLARSIASLHPSFETIEGADCLLTEYAVCDLALAAPGLVACELAACGVPALYLCSNGADLGSAFEAAGMGVSLGLASALSDRDIANAAWTLVNDSAKCEQMRSAGLVTVDGGAASRIAGELAKTLAARRGYSGVLATNGKRSG